MRFGVSLALAATTAYGGFTSCTPADYEVFLRSFAQGFQIDTTSIETECYGKTDTLAYKSSQLVNSFTSFKFDDWAAPLYILSEISVATTDVFAYCQTTNLAKQLSTRTSTLAGLFDLVATFGVSILKNYREKDSSPLYNAMVKTYEAETCAETANNMAQTLQYSFNYNVAISNYANQLGQDLTKEVFA